MSLLLQRIKGCMICKEHLPFAPRPILNFESKARILIVGQAPGLKAHNTRIPWNDASGERLREWAGVTKEQFYNPQLFAIVPMGFCYPGKSKSGDLPPRPECSQKWMPLVLKSLPEIQVTLVIGTYAQNYFLKSDESVTKNVKNWKTFAPKFFPLPHPSPRNNIWLKKNPWFEKSLVPRLRERIAHAIF